jgi:hypothetical protein
VQELTEQEYFGRLFSVAELKLVQEIVSDFRSLSVNEISETVCELLEWKRPNGRLKTHECRQMLERLSERGMVSLPAIRKRGPRGPRVVELTAQSEARPLISGSAGEIGSIKLNVVKAGRGGESRLWREMIARHHYLSYRAPVGANLRYMVYSERHRDTPIACMLWTSPAWKIDVRDRWIGWTSEARKRNLQLIVNNSRFLIMPWVRVRCLASKILGQCARQLPLDWERLYGYRPLMLESFVDSSRFQGTCYRAANWVLLGETKGRGRMDRFHTEEDGAKLVYVYPLCTDALKRLRSETTIIGIEKNNEEEED